MGATQIDASDVVRLSRQTTGVPDSQVAEVDQDLIRALLRRAAGILCPCSPTALRASLIESLQYLASPQSVSLPDRIDDGIADLLVVGDLLEVHEVVTTDASIRDTWVFGAPPSFIVRPSGTIFIVGIVPDQDTFLPSTLANRVAQSGNTRTITPETDEDLRDELLAHGFHEISTKAWLKAPKEERPSELLESIQARLAAQPQCGDINGLRILDTQRPVTYYVGRWTKPTNHDGWFIARRPQEFGSDLWCVVQLTSGHPVKLLDLPPTTSRWRGCDVAWHIQMALDRDRGTPQRYRATRMPSGMQFDFLSPIPQWAERRLLTVGEAVAPNHSIVSYFVPESEAEAEETFLQRKMWMARLQEREGRAQR